MIQRSGRERSQTQEATQEKMQETKTFDGQNQQILMESNHYKKIKSSTRTIDQEMLMQAMEQRDVGRIWIFYEPNILLRALYKSGKTFHEAKGEMTVQLFDWDQPLAENFWKV